MKKRYVLTHKYHEVLVINRPKVKADDYCELCRRDVKWVIPREAMAIARLSEREIFKLVELGGMHSVETSDGFVLICSDSLVL